MEKCYFTGFILFYRFPCHLIHVAFSLIQDDLLIGNGLFHTQSLTNFIPDSHHLISFLSVNSTNVLKLQKPLSSHVSFDTGLEYNFASSQPSHISFQFSSINPDTQDANLRLIDSVSGQTLLLFRAGKAGLVRVNQNQMICFYNNSVSNDSNVKTIKIDILLNWINCQVRVFVDGEQKGEATFFQKVSSVNKIRLYNLYQSTSYWKNLVVCTQNCYSFSNSDSLKLFIWTTLPLLFMILFSF